jgi:hypothetical protein
MNKAALCDGPHPKNARPVRIAPTRLCRDCLEAARRNLSVLPGLYADCAERRSRRGFDELCTRGHAGCEVSTPLTDEAVDARFAIRGILASWSEMVVAERRCRRAPRREVADMVAFLLRDLAWLAAHPAAGDFVIELAEVAADATRAIDRESSARAPLGVCPQDQCDAELWPDRVPGGIACSAGHLLRYDRWLLLSSAFAEGRR